MTLCACGHDIKRHCDGIGRCDGMSEDADYGRYRCVCPMYQAPAECDGRMTQFSGWSRIVPRCALPAGHDGHHATTYGAKFDTRGNYIQ